jgi:hypothetical protein
VVPKEFEPFRQFSQREFRNLVAGKDTDTVIRAAGPPAQVVFHDGVEYWHYDFLVDDTLGKPLRARLTLRNRVVVRVEIRPREG